MNMFKTSTAKNAEEYIGMLEEPGKSQIQELHNLIVATVPKLKPFIISGMIGYGKFHYKSKSGREGDWYVVGLAQQKNYISLYVCAVKDGKYIAEGYKDKLPKTSIGKSCIRFKRVGDVDLGVIKEILLEAERAPGFGF
jgi:hypothetical protein